MVFEKVPNWIYASCVSHCFMHKYNLPFFSESHLPVSIILIWAVFASFSVLLLPDSNMQLMDFLSVVFQSYLDLRQPEMKPLLNFLIEHVRGNVERIYKVETIEKSETNDSITKNWKHRRCNRYRWWGKRKREVQIQKMQQRSLIRNFPCHRWNNLNLEVHKYQFESPSLYSHYSFIILGSNEFINFYGVNLRLCIHIIQISQIKQQIEVVKPTKILKQKQHTKN